METFSLICKCFYGFNFLGHKLVLLFVRCLVPNLLFNKVYPECGSS